MNGERELETTRHMENCINFIRCHGTCPSHITPFNAWEFLVTKIRSRKNFCHLNYLANRKWILFRSERAIGYVFTSGFLGRLASENRKSPENGYFSNSLKVKRVGKLQ